jgi:hypothetical protein
MAVVLTSTGITFSDGSSTTTNLIPAGTLMVFQQTSAPTGWTKGTTHDNKAFRCVSGTCSSGGNVAFTTAMASRGVSGNVSVSGISGSAGNTTLSTPQIPSHNHAQPSWGQPQNEAPNRFSAHGIVQTSQIQNISTASSGGSGAHSHPFSFSSGSANFSGTAIDMSVQYVDLIIASKN